MEPEFCCGRNASEKQGYDEGEIHFSDYRLTALTRIQTDEVVAKQ